MVPEWRNPWFLYERFETTSQVTFLLLRPAYPNYVWSFDFMLERTHDGRTLRILNVIDEYTRE
jgi:hypothetical protein